MSPESGGKDRVIVSADKDHFVNFITSLLGKPQTITQKIPGVYELEIYHFINIYDLLDQRIKQQNAGRLIQFGVKIIYDDNSTRELRSRLELETYTNYNNLIPVSLHMSFTYLINFHNQTAPGVQSQPERQDIEISFFCSGLHKLDEKGFDREMLIRFTKEGFFETTIKHTAITWGADIESLLKNHFLSLKKISNPFFTFLSKHHGAIASIFSILFVIISITGFILTSNTYQNKRLSEFSEIIVDTDKLDYLATQIIQPSLLSSPAISIIYVIVILILAIAIGIWVDDRLDYTTPSILLKENLPQERKDKIEKKHKRKTLSLVFSLFVSIGSNLISSFIFLYINMKL